MYVAHSNFLFSLPTVFVAIRSGISMSVSSESDNLANFLGSRITSSTYPTLLFVGSFGPRYDFGWKNVRLSASWKNS